ncbi:MAG: hypothetical protein ACKVG6_03150 [Alphaproteobacteria bacterium]|jgi:hypothetical protein
MEDKDGRPLFSESALWEEAQAVLAEHELDDGLPMVLPTHQRLEAMLEGVADPARSYGMIPPLFGNLTAAAVAYNCVLAGCRPAELPAVLTAAEACLEPQLNLLGVLTTTGTPAIATVVHGPLAQDLGMNSGTNMLGPGNRANATMGRAIALVMRNIGGARALVGDMATMGQPGKYTFCFAEGVDALAPSLAVRRGFNADESAVTVLAVSGTVEVLPVDDADTPETVLTAMAAALTTGGALASAGRHREPGEQFFLLPPELAEKIRNRGWDLARVQDFLFDADCVSMPKVADFTRNRPIARSPEDIHPIITGGAGVKMTYLPLWGGGVLSVTRAIRNLRS